MADKKYGSNELCFTPPKGFVPPEGSEKGKPFDVVCTFEPTEDGQLELTMIGNTPVDKDKDEEGESKTESKPDYSQMAQGIMGGMQQAQGEQGGGGYA